MQDVQEDRNAAQKIDSKLTRRLSEPEIKALKQLKRLIQEGLNSYELAYFEGDFAMWGIPLLGDDLSRDFVILKFLKAGNFVASDAFSMIKNTARWREEVGIESLLEEDFGDVYEKVMFNTGRDKEGCNVWYLVMEECLNINPGVSSDVGNQRKLFRWLIRSVEKYVRKQNFSLTSTNSFVLVIDLKNSPYYGNRDLYKVVYKFLELLNDHYPEFVSKQLWINASWWYRTYCRVYSAAFESWSSDSVIFSGSSKTTDILFKYISPEQVPLKYGGLSRDEIRQCTQFTSNDPVNEVTIKPASKHTEEFAFAEEGDIFWELRVIGWDVSYEAEFVPSTKGRYITNITKLKKITPTDKSIISDNLRVVQPGKLVLTIHNTSLKKKKLIFRVRVTGSNEDMLQEPSLRGWLLQSPEK